VGGRKLIDLDVRILSATNRDPRQAVSENLLRQDLYYRLNVIPVQVPPLRERRDDIPLLVDHFLHVLAERHHRPMKGLAPAAMELLQRHAWPGNVRELQNTVHRLFVMTTADTIDEGAVRETMEPGATPKDDYATLFGMPLKDAKLKLAKQFECEYLQQLLTAHQYAIGRAAEAAGVNRKTLSRLADEHGLRLKE
jgi:DNA-binding NtrC family response regulator